MEITTDPMPADDPRRTWDLEDCLCMVDEIGSNDPHDVAQAILNEHFIGMGDPGVVLLEHRDGSGKLLEFTLLRY